MDPIAALAAAQDLYHRYVASGAVEVPATHAALEVYSFWLGALEPDDPQQQVIAGQAVLVRRGLAECRPECPGPCAGSRYGR
jgi:hypothetical protein